MTEEEFDKTLKLTRYALLMSGIKISKKHLNKIIEYFINHQLFYWNFFALYSVIFGEMCWITDGIKTGRSFVELSLISPCVTVSILGTIKTWYLYLNKEILIRVVEKLKEMHPTINDNEVFEETAKIKRKIIKESMKLLRIVQLVLANIYLIVFTMFCFTPLLLTWYHYYKTGELVVVYPFQVIYYFFDVSSWWHVIYVHQFWATIIVIMNVFGCDTLFFALCVYIKMHFRLLGLRIENIVSASRSETQRNLVQAVFRHQELIDLVNQAEILYSKSSLLNMVTSSLLICMSAFNITVADEMSTIVAFISFLVMSLSQISLVCFFADILMRSSMEISGAVYNSLWYEADKHTKRIILFVLMRSQKACKLTAWKFADLNLEAFTTILSRSWSYFALLKTVYK